MFLRVPYLIISCLVATSLHIKILSHPDSISFLSVGVMFKGALISPSLSYDCQLFIPNLGWQNWESKELNFCPDQFLHVASLWLISIGLFSSGHLGSELIMFIHNGLFGSTGEVSVDSLGSTRVWWSLGWRQHSVIQYWRKLKLNTVWRHIVWSDATAQYCSCVPAPPPEFEPTSLN